MDFFVYLHRRASNGKVFYVGKGTRYRHKSKWNRSQHWHNIVKKHGYTIEIVQHGMQEWWAFELETDLILKYKDHGLCNRTDGGEGASGATLSEEAKQKRRIFTQSESWRKNISNKAKERFANPEFKKAHAKRQAEIANRTDVKTKLRNAALKQFANPEVRNRAKLLTQKYFSNPIARQLARQKALARFDTPEKRAAHVQSKAIICLDNNMIFGSTTLAAEWVASWRGKADNSQIAKACRGLVPKAYNLRWRYLPPATAISG